VNDFDGVSEQELDRMIAETELSVPKLEEVERMLLEAINHRIAACNSLKEHVRATQGGATKDRLRDWRKQAKTDSMAEKYLRTARDLYGRVLELS